MLFCIYSFHNFQPFFESDQEVTNPNMVPTSKWKVLKTNIYQKLCETGATSYKIKNFQKRFSKLSNN